MKHVQIFSDSIDSNRVKVIDVETGAEIPGISRIDVVVEPNKDIDARVKLYTSINVQAKAEILEFEPLEPVTGLTGFNVQHLTRICEAMLPAGEPVFIIRAQDRVAVRAIEEYLVLAGAHQSKNLSRARKQRDRVGKWQEQYPHRVKVAD
jgi:hypothetical protein